MIASLTGRLLRRTAETVVIDVAGVGYLVAIPKSTSAALPEPGEPVHLHIHTYLREDTLSLFGFATEMERELFLVLTGVSGIGPKLALAVLSGLSADMLAASIAGGDDAKLCAIPGVGKKTAARICLELKDKVRQLLPLHGQIVSPSAGPGGVDEDAVSALMNLGYKRPAAEDAVKRAGRNHPQLPVEGLIREALSELSRK
jgi:Holliday junction DNA helicase RuvA